VGQIGYLGKSRSWFFFFFLFFFLLFFLRGPAAGAKISSYTIRAELPASVQKSGEQEL
jgi:hypothetical protein